MGAPFSNTTVTQKPETNKSKITAILGIVFALSLAVIVIYNLIPKTSKIPVMKNFEFVLPTMVPDTVTQKILKNFQKVVSTVEEDENLARHIIRKFVADPESIKIGEIAFLIRISRTSGNTNLVKAIREVLDFLAYVAFGAVAPNYVALPVEDLDEGIEELFIYWLIVQRGLNSPMGEATVSRYKDFIKDYKIQGDEGISFKNVLEQIKKILAKEDPVTSIRISLREPKESDEKWIPEIETYSEYIVRIGSKISRGEKIFKKGIPKKDWDLLGNLEIHLIETKKTFENKLGE